MQGFVSKIKFLCIIYNRKRTSSLIHDLCEQLIKESPFLINCSFIVLHTVLNCVLIFIEQLNQKWEDDVRYYTIHMKKMQAYIYIYMCAYIFSSVFWLQHWNSRILLCLKSNVDFMTWFWNRWNRCLYKILEYRSKRSVKDL